MHISSRNDNFAATGRRANGRLESLKRALPGLALIVLFSLPGAAVRGEDAFRDVVVRDRIFARSRTSPSLHIRTKTEARVDVVLYDVDGTPVAHVPAGPGMAVQHDVVLTNLPPVRRGWYSFCLVARDAQGARLGVYPETVAGGDRLEVEDCRWNIEQEQVEYLLPKAAFARIRAGLTDGAYLRAVLPWEVQAAGRHRVAWTNAMSDAAVKELSGRPDFQVRVLALSLPVNLLADEEQRSPTRPSPESAAAVALPPALEDLARMPWPGVLVDAQTRNRIAIDDDYRLTLEVGEEPGQRIATFRLDCVAADRQRLLNRRFEIMLSVDGVFLTEDEHALLPFNYRMSVRGLTPGQHLFTVNVLDSEGVPGTISRVFAVPSSTSGSR